ncbi:MAG: phosphinothricin acetyltransferase [Desulfobulbus propionicus]|nr:MAG: phosphinothricin acetyltransferase [Desulfobulbus propionicus]
MIREASAKDAGSISKIYNHYVKNTVVTFEEDEVNSEEFIRRISEVKASGLWWLVALEKDQVIGYAYSSRWNNRSAYKNTVEVSVYLSCSDISRGWGTKLYSELFSKLRGQGIHSVICCITLPNPPSVAIREKFGLQKVGHFKEVGYKFGQWLDVGYWQMQLSSRVVEK